MHFQNFLSSALLFSLAVPAVLASPVDPEIAVARSSKKAVTTTRRHTTTIKHVDHISTKSHSAAKHTSSEPAKHTKTKRPGKHNANQLASTSIVPKASASPTLSIYSPLAGRFHLIAHGDPVHGQYLENSPKGLGFSLDRSETVYTYDASSATIHLADSDLVLAVNYAASPPRVVAVDETATTLVPIRCELGMSNRLDCDDGSMQSFRTVRVGKKGEEDKGEWLQMTAAHGDLKLQVERAT